jgi:hypothetical protein
MHSSHRARWSVLLGLLVVFAAMFVSSGRPDYESPAERWPPALAGLIESGASILGEMVPARELPLRDWFPAALRDWFEGQKAYSYLVLHEPQLTAANVDRLRLLAGQLDRLNAMFIYSTHEPVGLMAQLRAAFPHLRLEHRAYSAVALVAAIDDVELAPDTNALRQLFRRNHIDWECTGHQPRGTTFSVRPGQADAAREIVRRAARTENLNVTLLPATVTQP